MKAKFPVILLNDTTVDRHFGCELVCSAIDVLVDQFGGKIIARAPAHSDWRKDDIVLRAFESARLVLINGEGTIHHDRSGGRLLLEAGRESRVRGIPCALINAGWEANSEQLVGKLDDFALLSARDEESAVSMSDGARKVQVVPDLSLFAVRHGMTGQLAGKAVTRSGVGYTDSVERMQTLKIATFFKTRKARPISIHADGWGYVEFLRAGLAMREDWRRPGRKARLLRARNDMWRARLPNSAAFILAVGALELLVSGRFHASTVALAARTPLVGVPSNTSKIARLIDDVGLEKWRARSHLDEISLFGESLNWTAQERVQLDGYLERASTDALSLFAELAALAQ